MLAISVRNAVINAENRNCCRCLLRNHDKKSFPTLPRSVIPLYGTFLSSSRSFAKGSETNFTVIHLNFVGFNVKGVASYTYFL